MIGDDFKRGGIIFIFILAKKMSNFGWGLLMVIVTVLQVVQMVFVVCVEVVVVAFVIIAAEIV